jgi:DMSO/TMAO reductase YedYZ molybdopterin-dependent catalytic subunit
MVLQTVQGILGRLRDSLAAPSRTPRMAVVIGRLLAIAFLLCFGTGVYSHFLQDPLPWMVFTTRPTWLYQLTQGVHITAGILCFPLLFAKLYSVFPGLFQTPAIRSFPHFLERASIALFVSASLVQIVTGLLNTYQWYALFPFPFRQTHYALSYVIIGSLAIHIAVKLPVIQRYWRKDVASVAEPVEAGSDIASGTSTGTSTSSVESSATVPGATHTLTSSPTRNALVRVEGVTGRVFDWIDGAQPAEPRTSRRGFLTVVGVASAAVVAFTAGQSFRVLDGTNIFGPRKQGIGPNGLPVNRTAAAAKVEATATSADWRLVVSNGATSRAYSRAELLALPQHEVELPIACVEGWSQTARWSGVRVGDLVDSVGGEGRVAVRLTSLEQDSSYAVTTMGAEYVRDDLTLIALELNGEVLDLDHGYPARAIAPGRPGVMQTKWLSSLEVLS